MTPLLTLSDLAEILRMKPRSVQDRYYKAPQTLPKPLRLPGNRRTLWSRESVDQWLKECAK